MSKRAIIFGGLGLALVAAAAFFLMDPDPQAVLRKAQRKLVTEDAVRLDAEGRLVLPPEDLAGAIAASATGIDIVMRTDLDFSVPLDPSSVTAFAFTQAVDGEAATLSGETRRKEGRHYLKLDEPGRLETELAGRLKGIWVASDRPFLEFVLPPDERVLAERPLDLAGVTAMAIAITEVDLFRVTEKLPTATIDGVKARHYAVELNMDAVSALLLKLRELRTGAPLQAEDVLAVTAEVVRWGQPLGEVWIDKRTGKFHRIELVSALEGDASAGAVGGSVIFSRYGERTPVVAPEAEDIEKVLGPLFTKRLSLADDRADDAPDAPAASALPSAPTAPGTAVQEADTDGDGLADGQEFFYGSDAWNPDTDGDGWNDGLEVAKGMDPVGPGALFSFGL